MLSRYINTLVFTTERKNPTMKEMSWVMLGKKWQNIWRFYKMVSAIYFKLLVFFILQVFHVKLHRVNHSWIREIKAFISGWNTDEYGGYTVHTRIWECTDTHSVSMWIKSCILLYSIYLGKYCAVFKIQGMKYLILSNEYRKLQLNTMSWLLWDCKLLLLL